MRNIRLPSQRPWSLADSYGKLEVSVLSPLNVLTTISHMQTSSLRSSVDPCLRGPQLFNIKSPNPANEHLVLRMRLRDIASGITDQANKHGYLKRTNEDGSTITSQPIYHHHRCIRILDLLDPITNFPDQPQRHIHQDPTVRPRQHRR
jgi:hypothetical protein